jgi:hypothetical protein
LKKILPYLLIGIVVAGVITLILTSHDNDERRFDGRLSFSKKDKIPYGTYVAFNNLKYLFPVANISVNDREPGYWDSLSNYESNQALIIVSPTFYADEFEMKKIIRFAENGNDVFISAAILSDEVKNILNCGTAYVDVYDLLSERPIHTDSLEVSLTNPPFQRSYSYKYPGRRLSSYFHEYDTTVSTVLGRDDAGRPDFIHLKAGQGNLYVHLAPMTFSNYFILRSRNMSYYEDALSVISRDKKKIVWDEYYLHKKYPSVRQRGNDNQDDDEQKGLLGTLFSYPALKWGLLTFIFTLLVYVLLEMRRKQRFIPVINRPRNESLDFVKTIGRLYYDKGDHRNLCRKMAAYFLEHVRNRYKLKTAELDDEFIKNLQYKTGVEESEIRSIVLFIRELEDAPAVSDHQLHYFHKQLESFYNKA